MHCCIGRSLRRLRKEKIADAGRPEPSRSTSMTPPASVCKARKKCFHFGSHEGALVPAERRWRSAKSATASGPCLRSNRCAGTKLRRRSGVACVAVRDVPSSLIPARYSSNAVGQLEDGSDSVLGGRCVAARQRRARQLPRSRSSSGRLSSRKSVFRRASSVARSVSPAVVLAERGVVVGEVGFTSELGCAVAENQRDDRPSLGSRPAGVRRDRGDSTMSQPGPSGKWPDERRDRRQARSDRGPVLWIAHCACSLDLDRFYGADPTPTAEYGDSGDVDERFFRHRDNNPDCRIASNNPTIAMSTLPSWLLAARPMPLRPAAIKPSAPPLTGPPHQAANLPSLIVLLESRRGIVSWPGRISANRSSWDRRTECPSQDRSGRRAGLGRRSRPHRSDRPFTLVTSSIRATTRCLDGVR